MNHTLDQFLERLSNYEEYEDKNIVKPWEKEEYIRLIKKAFKIWNVEKSFSYHKSNLNDLYKLTFKLDEYSCFINFYDRNDCLWYGVSCDNMFISLTQEGFIKILSSETPFSRGITPYVHQAFKSQIDTMDLLNLTFGLFTKEEIKENIKNRAIRAFDAIDI